MRELNDFEPFAAVRAALRDRAGALLAAGMSRFYNQNARGILLVGESLVPCGYLRLRAAQKLQRFPALAKELSGYQPRGEVLVLAVDAHLAVLFRLSCRSAVVHLLGGGLVTECLVLESESSPPSQRPNEGSRKAEHEYDQHVPDRPDLHLTVALEVNAGGGGLKSSEREEAIDGRKRDGRQQTRDECDEHRLPHALNFTPPGERFPRRPRALPTAPAQP